MIRIKKLHLTLIIVLLISIILLAFIFKVNINTSSIENFNDFNTQKRILTEFIKEGTKQKNLSSIPILNGVNPNTQIQKKLSTYTPVNNDPKLDLINNSVNIQKVNKQNQRQPDNKPKKNIIINKSITQDSCKYIPSFSSTPECPAGYNIFSGASMGIENGKLSCNGQTISNEGAEGRVTIEDGSLKKIYLTNPGSNYMNKPTISIIGDGKLGTASCSIKNGKVVKVIITNPGKNYSYPPKVEFSRPDGMVYCHLCCQDLNSIID